MPADSDRKLGYQLLSLSGGCPVCAGMDFWTMDENDISWHACSSHKTVWLQPGDVMTSGMNPPEMMAGYRVVKPIVALRDRRYDVPGGGGTEP